MHRSLLVAIFCGWGLMAFGQYGFDAICCWGDSKTQGGHEQVETSYPQILQQLLFENGDSIRVFNFGANGEKSIEVMMRQGAYPLIVMPFIIPATCEEVQISLNSQLTVPEAGCNPCVIGGVVGTIRHDWTGKSKRTLFFRRSKEGKAVDIVGPMVIITDAMMHHRNDVLIMDIGYNGGFLSIPDWISQYQRMVNYSRCKEFIVIGRASHLYGPSDFEAQFEEAFGGRFINLRKYYVEHGLEDAGLVPTEGDLEDIRMGIPPRSLFIDEQHENVYGYTIKARLVYQRLRELGILNKNIDY